MLLLINSSSEHNIYFSNPWQNYAVAPVLKLLLLVCRWTQMLRVLRLQRLISLV